MDDNGPSSPIQIQQQYFENIGECDWIRYEKSNRSFMLQNMAFALFGAPVNEGELTSVVPNGKAHLEGYTSRQNERIMEVFTKVCEQSKYSLNNEDIFMSIILIVCARPQPLKFYKIEPFDYWHDLHNRTDSVIWCTAVFRIRKCIPTTTEAKSCQIYIDENARVYQNWQSYLENNTQPKCVLIVPENGEYKAAILNDNDFAVKLSVVPSPSLGLKAKVLSATDTASSVVSLGAIGVLGVAAFTPVGPIVLAGATIASVTTGIYGLIRSSLHLHDRNIHEQTLNPTNPDARGSWLNITASSVGITSAAAAGLLSKTVTSGTNLTKAGQCIAASVDVLRHANIITGGAGILHSLFHIITKYHKHGETPTKLELFQLSAATLFFCHSFMSNRTAQEIVEESQTKTINEYRETLRSNRHRKIFDKISAETRRVQGAVQGNTEVINSIKNIADKDQFFADVLRINKDLNVNKLKISMTADGNVNLNAQYKYHPSDLSNLGKDGRSNLFSNLGPNTIDTPNVSTRLTSGSVTSFREVDKDEHPITLGGLQAEDVIKIGQLLIRVSQTDIESIARITQDLSTQVHVDLMTVSANLLSKLVELPDIVGKIMLLSPNGNMMVVVVDFVFRFLKERRPFGETDLETDAILIGALKEFFQDGMIKKETIIKLKNEFLHWIDKELDAHRQLYPYKQHIICPICSGVRFA